MNIEKRLIKDLAFAEYNPRKHLTPADEEYQKIKRSIEEFGYVDPVIINSDNTIIGGHQRVTVLKDLSYDEIDVVVVALDKTKEKALNLALNKISGEWDQEKLAALLEELEKETEIIATGFEAEEIRAIIEECNEIAEATPQEDNFNVEVEEDVPHSLRRHMADRETPFDMR